MHFRSSPDIEDKKMNPQMTEKQLREAEERLNKVVCEGNATVAQANQLAEIRRDLRRIDAVKYKKAW